MILPSKKVLSIFVITVALVIAIIITFGRDKSSEAINYASDLVAGERVSVPENPDWQDELGQIGLLNTKTEIATSSEAGTATDILSISLISNYLALKQNNKLDATSAQKLIDQSVDLADQLVTETANNTKLNIVADNGSRSIIDYGEKLGMIFKNIISDESDNELKILNTALTTKDPVKLDELDNVITIYENVAFEMEKMPVPQTFTKAHLDMTDSLKNVAIALRGSKLIFIDPIKGLMYLQLYQKSSDTFKQAREATKNFIIQNNVTYKQGSGGYYFLYGV